jgi:hypothetical protein
MAETFIRRRGLDFPKDLQEPFIDLLFAKRWREPEFRASSMDKPGTHMLRAIRALFTPDQWNTASSWTEEHCHAWCEETTLGILGCASSSKSWDVGGLALLDWLTDPTDTVTIMASTSKIALADRTFSSSLKLFRILKNHPRYLVPGKISKTTMAILLDSDSDIATTDKTALRGVALNQGTAEENRGSIQGRHAPYSRIIGDELAAMKDSSATALIDATTNLRIGAEKDFKFVYLANPESKTDECGKLSEPEGGWESVDENTPRWRTKGGGLVLRRNGFQSPAVTEPDGEKKYPYLIRQAQIDDVVKAAGSADSVRVWVMCRGFPPPTGLHNTVLSEPDISAYELREPAVWHNIDTEMLMCAGCDPAFTSSGDHAVLQPLKVGRFANGLLGAEFLDPIRLVIEASSGTPVVYQLIRQIRQALTNLNIPPANVCYDDSGTQSVADVAENEFGVGPQRCNFGARASDLPLGLAGRPAKEQCRDQVTEAWMTVAALARSRQLRRMPEAAVAQFCSRRFKQGKPPQALESKIDYKARTKASSPDEADAVALACLAARRVLGLTPGALAPTRSAYGGFSRLPRPISSGYGAPTDFSKFGNF